MAQKGGQIKLGVGFDVDTSGLNKLKQSLSEIKRLTATEIQNMNIGMGWEKANESLDDIRKNAVKVEAALEKAFNKDLGTINVAKFNKELKNLDLNKIQSSFIKAGAAGQNAFRSMTTEILTTNMQLKQSHTLINKMAETMANTVKWGIASSVMNSFTGSVQKAYGYVKNLDSSLNDIRIVTGKSAEEMDVFAVKANKAAKALGQSTRNYTDASLIYYQQGLSEQDVQARAETTLKAANVTKQSGEAVSEQLTAVWNGYKVSAQEAELYVDKLAAVAASTATDLEELSVGMGKVASAAATMGVDIDQLNGHLATVISVTRQAPESVGTAFKTIYARMSDLKLGGTDEDGLGLGDVSGTMEAMGIQVLDQTGNLRDMGEVMEDVAAKWDTWTEAQKTAMAQVMAGKRQYNNLMALFENWDMYEEAVNTSANAMGTLQNQQDIYMESTEAHLQGLSTSMEDLYDSILDEGTINSVADSLAGLADLAGNFVDAIGGGQGILLNFGSIAGRVFSRQIAGGIATSITNLKGMISNTQQLSAETEILQQFKDQAFKDKDDPYLRNLIEKKQQTIELRNVMSEAQQNEANDMIKLTNELQNQKQAWDENVNSATEFASKVSGREQVNLTDEELLKDSDNTELQNRYDEARAQLDEFMKGIDESTDGIEIHKNGIEDYKKSLEELKGTLREAARSQKDLNKTGKDGEKNVKTYEDLEEAIDEAGKEMDELIDLSKKLGIAEKERSKLVEDKILFKEDKSPEKMSELLSSYDGLVSAMEAKGIQIGDILERQNAGFGNSINSKINETNQAWDSFTSNLKLTQTIKGFLDIAASIGQVTGAMQTLAGIKNILNDDSLSAGEKFLQVTSALAMAIPQLVTGFGGMTSALGNLITAFGVSSAATETDMAIKTKHTAASKAGAIATKLFGESFKTAIPWVIAITAAITVLISVVSLLINAFNAKKRALEEAQKNLDSISGATEKAKSHAQGLLDTFKKYDEIQTTLRNLKEGTEEWKNALQDSNDIVLDLLKNIPELAKHVKVNENGQLIIDAEEKGKVEEHYENVQTNSETLEILATIKRNDAKKDLEEDDYKGFRAQDLEAIQAVEKRYKSTGDYSFIYDREKLEEARLYNTDTGYKLNESQLDYIFEDSERIGKFLSQQKEDMDTLVAQNEVLGEKLVSSHLNKIEEYKNATQEEQNALLKYASEKNEENFEDIYKDKYEGQYDFLGTNLHEMGRVALGASEYEDLGNDKVKYKIGDEWSEEFSDDNVREMLAYIDAAQATQEEIITLLNTAQKIQNENYKTTTDGIKSSLYSFDDGQKGDLSQLSDNELDLWKQAIENGQFLISEEQAEALGWERASELIEAITEAIKTEQEEREEQIRKKPEQAIEPAKTSFENAEFSDETRANIQTGIDEAGGLENILKGIDFSELADYNLEELFSNVDWSQLNIDWSKVPADGITAWLQDALNKSAEEIDLEQAEALEEIELNEDIKTFELDVEEVEDYANHLQDIAKESDKVADSLEDNELAAKKVATANMRMNKGLEDLGENFEDYKKVLEDGQEGTEEYAEAMNSIKKNMEDVLNVDAGSLSDDFIVNNLKDIEAAANGDVEAIERLRNAAAQDILMQVMGVSDFSQLDADMQNLHNQIANFASQNNLEIGASVDNAQFIAACNEMIAASGMTAEEVGNYFKAMGYDANVKTEKKTIEGHVEKYTEKGKAFAGVDKDGEPKFVDIETEVVKTWPAQEVEVPVVEALTYTGSAGGTVNFSNAGGRSGGSSGGGGGGSGGGSTPKKKTTEPKKNPRDRYRTVNNELDKLSTKLNRLADAQNRLYGADLSKNLEKQLEIIQKQAYWSQQKLNIMEEERAELQKELEESGITFDANLEISNYDDILKAQEDNIQNLYAQRNAAAADSEEEKELDEKIADAEEARDKLLESIERYDELIYSEMPDLQDAIVEMAQQKIDIELEKFNIKINISLDLADAVKEWGDFERDMLEDTDLTGMGKSFVSEMGKLMSSGVAESLTSGLNNTANEIKAMNANPYTYNGIYALKDDKGNVLKNEDGTVMVDEAKAMEELKNKQGDLMNHLRDIKELEKEINELYLDSIDNIEEAYNAQTENFEFINDQLEHSLNMIELIKGKEAYEEMGKVFEQQSQNYNALLKSQKEAVDYYRQMMETETDPEAKKKWIEMWKDATNELNETVEASIELLNEQYKNTINKTIKDMDEAFGGKSARAEWEIALKKDDNYLDGVNSLYEIQALENKINEGINNTDSLSAQKRLNKLKEEELTKLREKDKLTQYDVDRANQLYEIELKKIALEEAQQNKSKMRLRRDSSGNYSYQFVADEDAQAQAQQELDDAQNKLYNMDKEEFKSRQEEFYETWEEYQDKMREYSELSYEERLAREDEFNEYFEYYQNRMVELSGNMNSIKQNLNQSTFDALSSLYEEDGRKFEELTDLEKSQLVDKLQPEFANTMAAMNTMLMGENGYAETWKMADDAINLANDTVKAGIEEIENALGLESGGLSDTTSEYYTSATELAKDFIAQQDIEIQNVIAEKNAVNELRTEVQLLKQDWQDVFDAANAALQASQNLREQRAREEQERIAQEEAEKNKQNNGSGDSGGSGSGSGSGDGKITSLTDKIIDGVSGAIWYWTPAAWGNGEERKKKIEEKFGKGSYAIIQSQINKGMGALDYKYENRDEYKKYYYSKFDTGGYTGRWNSKEGKFAMLHEKELILNKDDTANMLAMVKMVREIMGLGSQISTLDTSHEDKSTQSFQEKLNKLVDSVDNFKEKYLYEQKVDSLSLLQKFEELRQGLDKNEQMEELLRIEDYSSKYQEMLNEERKQEMEMLLNRLTEMEKKNEVFSNNRRKEIDVLERSISNSLTELKHIIKDSFKDKIDKVNPMFSDGGGGGGGKSAEDSKQNTIINIHADFPDVSSAKEIQLAFDNLVNMASQRAYSTSVLRKK